VESGVIPSFYFGDQPSIWNGHYWSHIAFPFTRRPGPVSADGPRHPVSVRSFSEVPKYWGIIPCFAFIEPPQTNGAAERFILTLKEQVIYGQVFQNLEEVRTAVRRFVETYNLEWRVEKIDFKSPWQARAEWLAQDSLARAA
jgi:hypothetical protein